MNDSISCRAWVLIFFSIPPPLPMIIPLWDAFSQYMVTWQSMISVSSRWENFVTSTAVPWGISLSSSRSSFSRTISAMICRSGWSVTAPSGKSWGPSGSHAPSTSSSSSTPSPVLAEMGTTASQS